MIFTDEYINGIILKVEEASKNKDKDYFCSSRDVFQVRIDSYALGTSKYLESAIIGEIGNNTFDHNWDFAEGHARGTYLKLYDFENTVILADFGRGIRKSLERVYQAKDDKAALEIAFTQQISGRAPEQRGNGLKFVLENMQKKNWDLYFQSGIGCCIISDGIVTFKENNVDILGCLAILVFDGGKDEYTNK